MKLGTMQNITKMPHAYLIEMRAIRANGGMLTALQQKRGMIFCLLLWARLSLLCAFVAYAWDSKPYDMTVYHASPVFFEFASKFTPLSALRTSERVIATIELGRRIFKSARTEKNSVETGGCAYSGSTPSWSKKEQHEYVSVCAFAIIWHIRADCERQPCRSMASNALQASLNHESHDKAIEPCPPFSSGRAHGIQKISTYVAVCAHTRTACQISSVGKLNETQ